MDLPDLKALTKLANACRKAGIKSFTGNGYSFELSPDSPEPRRRKKSAPQRLAEDNGKIDLPDALTPEQLLNWSVTGAEEFSEA